MHNTAPHDHPGKADHRQSWPEARYRIEAANALPRRIRVVFLDDDDPDVALCRLQPRHANVEFSGPAAFLAATGMTPAVALAELGAGVPADGGGRVPVPDDRLDAWRGVPDLVVIVGGDADDPALGMLAARLYRRETVSVSGLFRIAAAPVAGAARSSDTLRTLCSTMLLVNDIGYLDDLLQALATRQ